MWAMEGKVMRVPQRFMAPNRKRLRVRFGLSFRRSPFDVRHPPHVLCSLLYFIYLFLFFWIIFFFALIFFSGFLGVSYQQVSTFTCDP